MNPSDRDHGEPPATDEVAMDDAALNAYLARDSAVSQRYRELDAPDVPAALDQAILSQAKAAIAGKKVSRWRGVTRWSAPLALAASIVLVVSIVLQPSMKEEFAQAPAPLRADRRASPPRVTIAVPPHDVSSARDGDDSAALAKQERIEESAPRELETPARKQASNEPQRKEAPRAPAVAPPPPAAPAPEQVAVTATRMQAQQNTQASPVAIESAAVAEESSQAARSKRSESDLSEVVVTGSYMQPPPSSSAGPRGSVSRARAGFEQSVDKNDPHAWLDYIRELRGEGKASRADTEWRRFRTRYPDFAVADDDSARPPRH